MRRNVRWPWKTMGWALVMVLGVGVGLVAIIENPSKHDSKMRLELMIRDMDAVLNKGGVVDSTYFSAKIGGALLTKNIKADSWSFDLAKSYQFELLRRGWLKKTDNKKFMMFCKDGMLAKIGIHPEVDGSRGLPREIYGFSMIYDVGSERKCR